MRPGDVVAERYRVVRHLGSGAMASVHLAEDPVLGRAVAIKSVETGPETEYGRRVLREARLGAALSHPNLVSVFDTVVEDGAVLIVMEYVPGETLDAALARGAMAPERALEILGPLAEALDLVHSAGIVHRDVKPANVLLSERGTVKLADLGVATSDEATRITRTGGVLGTAAYMAPEQFDPDPVTAAADIYALATVAFQMLTGRRPYTGATFYAVMAQVREGEPPDAREARPSLPVAVAAALRRGMATRPDDRPITARMLVEELEAGFRPAAADRPPPAAPAAAPPTERVEPVERRTPAPAPPHRAPASPAPVRRTGGRRAAPVLGALAAVLAAAGAVVVLTTGGDDDPGGTAATQARGAATSATGPAATGTATGTTGTATGGSGTGAALAPADPSSPAGAVRAFYERAAGGDLDGAWELAGPGLRAQLGPRATFDGTFRTLERIRFRRLDEEDRSDRSATVRVATTATHTDRTDRCTGTATTAAGDAGTWVVERIGVRCTSG